MITKYLTKVLFVLLTLLLITVSSCKKDDLCENITCLNGGTCVNGACDCPEGFAGPDCSNQQTPSVMRITNIKITRFPATASNGAGWDVLDGADLYIKMYYNNSLIYSHPTFYENANPNVDYDFPPNVNLNITNPTNRYVISAYDYDTFDDDFMGGIEFTPYSSNGGFPDKINLDTGGTIAFEVSVEYTF